MFPLPLYWIICLKQRFIKSRSDDFFDKHACKFIICRHFAQALWQLCTHTHYFVSLAVVTAHCPQSFFKFAKRSSQSSHCCLSLLLEQKKKKKKRKKATTKKQRKKKGQLYLKKYFAVAENTLNVYYFQFFR